MAPELAIALGARRVGKRWVARCPAHDDKTPSLSITEANDGRVLVHCFAGCTQDSVIAALRDLGLWRERSQSTHHAMCLNPANQYAAKLFKIGYAWRVERELEKAKVKLNSAPDPQDGEFRVIATLTAVLAKCLKWSYQEAYRFMRVADKRVVKACIGEAGELLSRLMVVVK